MIRPLPLFTSLVVISLVSLCAGFFSGTIDIGLTDLWSISELHKQVLIHIRLPRCLNAFLVGASLAAAGAAFQGTLRNPLADPYVLGVSAGAGLGASLIIAIPFINNHNLAISTGAFLGAISSIFLVYFIVKLSRQSSVTTFILAGIIINAFFSAMMLTIFYFSKQKLFGIMNWLMGDLGKASLDGVFFSSLFIIPLSLALTILGYQLNILSTGDESAASLGVNVDLVRKWVFFLASSLTGLAVALAGIIGFVGLIVPHILRLLIKEDFRILIPASFLLGGAFLVNADTLSRMLLPVSDLPIGVFTSFLGGPFFIFIMIRTLRKYRR